MKDAKRVKRAIGEVTLKNVETYVRKREWDIYYYGNGGAGDKFLEKIGLRDFAETVDSLSCRFKTGNIIFVKDSFTRKQKLFLALHEIGHLELGHDIGRLNFSEEREADQFADICLKQGLPKWVWAISAALIVAWLIFFSVAHLSNISLPAGPLAGNTNGAGSVYITANGDKFHRPDCIYVDGHKNVIEINREDAVKIGKEPCKVCKP